MIRSTFITIALLIAAMSFNSCDELTTDVDTTLTKDITVAVEEGQMKGTDDVFPYNVSDILDMTENSDIQEYLSSIEELNVSTITCVLSNIPDGVTINELTISIPEVNISVTLDNLTLNNEELLLSIAEDQLETLSAYLLENNTITIVVSGSASLAPFQFNVGLNLETIITAGV